MMLRQPTIEKLHALRLSVMAQSWQEQDQIPKVGDLSFDERFSMLVDAEHLARDNRRLSRLLRDANLRLREACIEDVKATPERGLPQAKLRQMAQGAWIGEHLNVLVTGPTGVGKSYLACALGQMACRRGHRVAYRRVPRFFEEASLAKADGTYTKLMATLAKADVLILDDLGLGTLREAQRHDLLEVLEDRYGDRSTIVTSQLPISGWHDWVNDPTVADAILDRLVHNAYKIELNGASGRKEKAKS
jgi:DNA replication protein DnaC